MNRPSVSQILPHLLIMAVLAGIVIDSRQPAPADESALRVLELAPCRLDRGTCRAQVAEGAWLDLSVAPRPVPAGTPFSASMRVHGLTVKSVELEFEGTDMNMGLFRQALSPQSAGDFSSDVTLPICATGAMRWHARLVVRTATGTLVAPFELTTGITTVSGA